ncbi:MAG TPA: hypothetical protein VET86_06365 [Casimicrobiaceae bacterium]|jgi:hypothetical protein|nr:hypothetical protein [Casimicrobiaceae bacterium]
MPTARELLEQADALMRRNRGREPEPDIPELTDEVAVGAPAGTESLASDHDAAPAPSATVEDVPELTDAIGRVEEVSIEALPDEGDESQWLESAFGGTSVTGPAPDSIAVVPPSTLRASEPAFEPSVEVGDAAGHSNEHKLSPETAAALGTAHAAPAASAAATPADAAFDAMLGLRPADAELDREFAPPELLREPTETPVADVIPDTTIAEASPAPVAAPEEPPPAPPPPPSWDAVAEEIRMQVLQRIDIFTDTGLQGELAARLQPVVDRASADLIATINREVGQLLRTYVAEAIEREIEKWRQSNP